jgi:hypothetical protein
LEDIIKAGLKVSVLFWKLGTELPHVVCIKLVNWAVTELWDSVFKGIDRLLGKPVFSPLPEVI